MFTYAQPVKKLPLLPLGLAMAAGLFLALAASSPAHADATDGSAKCTTSNNEAGVYLAIGIAGTRCVPITDGSLQGNPIYVYLVAGLQIASGLIGLAVVGGFTWGSILYVSARANSGQVEKAKLVMVNAVIGLMLFIFMYAILQFMIPGGIFN